MSTATEAQAFIESMLPGLNRYQIEDLCGIVRLPTRVEMIERQDPDTEQQRSEGWAEYWRAREPRLLEVLQAAEADNLHSAVAVLGDLAGSLRSSDVDFATEMLARLAEAAGVIASRKGV